MYFCFYTCMHTYESQVLYNSFTHYILHKYMLNVCISVRYLFTVVNLEFMIEVQENL